MPYLLLVGHWITDPNMTLCHLHTCILCKCVRISSWDSICHTLSTQLCVHARLCTCDTCIIAYLTYLMRAKHLKPVAMRHHESFWRFLSLFLLLRRVLDIAWCWGNNSTLLLIPYLFPANHGFRRDNALSTHLCTCVHSNILSYALVTIKCSIACSIMHTWHQWVHCCLPNKDVITIWSSIRHP